MAKTRENRVEMSEIGGFQTSWLRVHLLSTAINWHQTTQTGLERDFCWKSCSVAIELVCQVASRTIDRTVSVIEIGVASGAAACRALERVAGGAGRRRRWGRGRGVARRRCCAPVRRRPPFRRRRGGACRATPAECGPRRPPIDGNVVYLRAELGLVSLGLNTRNDGFFFVSCRFLFAKRNWVNQSSRVAKLTTCYSAVN